MQKILVIGAQNIDLFAHAKSDYILHDSNPSKIHMAFGGVGCNIATNLSVLGNQVDFLTVFGTDYFSQIAKQNLIDLKIHFEESLLVEDARSSIYLGVMDKENDLLLGLHDMEIIKHLDVAFFKEKTAYIESFDTLVLDNNLSIDALDYLLKAFKYKKIIMDAVSAKKATKLQELLPYISLLKINLLELEALSNKASITDKIDDLLSKGLSSLILTNSAQEIVYKTHQVQINTMPIPVEKIENATGAGDAFLAGFIHGLMFQKTEEECLEIAKKAAYICLQSPNSTIQKTK